MHLQFYGAAGEVTGSCHIVDIGGRRLLIDCGLIQGGATPDERNRAPFPFDAAGIDAVILSHAHIDHCGRLPLLHRRGFRGVVYATAACRDLARILLMDGAVMQQRDADRENRRRARDGRKGRAEPLYTEDDAQAALRTHPVRRLRARVRGAAWRRAHVPRRGPHPGLGQRVAASQRRRSRATHRFQRRPRAVRLAHPARP